MGDVQRLKSGEEREKERRASAVTRARERKEKKTFPSAWQRIALPESAPHPWRSALCCICAHAYFPKGNGRTGRDAKSTALQHGRAAFVSMRGGVRCTKRGTMGRGCAQRTCLSLGCALLCRHYPVGVLHTHTYSDTLPLPAACLIHLSSCRGMGRHGEQILD